ncbi:hypothetical protein ACIPLC_28820 [Kitasatospora sp. NPDC086801]|uniref:hypothetical protein n=1 Tax=Kitasatospora sp. NPDC086801 TaxID=3364066 RepID=UPI0038288FA2
MARKQQAGGRHRRMCQWSGCQRYANLRDLDTGQDFCLTCALAMLHAADDPITNFREFDSSTEYAEALRNRPILGLFGWPGTIPPDDTGR